MFQADTAHACEELGYMLENVWLKNWPTVEVTTDQLNKS